MNYDVLVPGNYFCDVIFTGMPSFPELGAEIYCQDLHVVPGGMLNTVVTMKRLGLRVGWAGALGKDFFSRFIREWANGEGLCMDLVSRRDEPLRRVTVALPLHSERAFVSYVDPAPDPVELAQVHLKEQSIRHLHFSGLVVDERLPDLLRDCKDRGVEVSMDCQHREQTLEDPLVSEILGLLDLFMPNAVEARKLTGAADVDNAAHELGQIVPTLVIKEGEHGARCWQGGRCFHSPALPVTVTDTTGAGDVFNAAFIAAHLAGADLAVCLQQGTVAGSLSTQMAGGANSAPDRSALQAAMVLHSEMFADGPETPDS